MAGYHSSLAICNPFAQGVAMGQALQAQTLEHTTSLQGMESSMLNGLNQLGQLVAGLGELMTSSAGRFFCFQHQECITPSLHVVLLVHQEAKPP